MHAHRCVASSCYPARCLALLKSPQNVAFGMGGGLLQRLNRDTLSLATKLSHIVYQDGTGTWLLRKGHVRRRDTPCPAPHCHLPAALPAPMPSAWCGASAADFLAGLSCLPCSRGCDEGAQDWPGEGLPARAAGSQAGREPFRGRGRRVMPRLLAWLQLPRPLLASAHTPYPASPVSFAPRLRLPRPSSSSRVRGAAGVRRAHRVPSRPGGPRGQPAAGGLRQAAGGGAGGWVVGMCVEVVECAGWELALPSKGFTAPLMLSASPTIKRMACPACPPAVGELRQAAAAGGARVGGAAPRGRCAGGAAAGEAGGGGGASGRAGPGAGVAMGSTPVAICNADFDDSQALVSFVSVLLSTIAAHP